MRGVLSLRVWAVLAVCAATVLVSGPEACPGDARAIQGEIDRAATQGGAVHVPPGRYVLRAALTLRSKVRVVGTPGSTVLASCDGAKTLLARDAGPNGDQIVLADEAVVRAIHQGEGAAKIRPEPWPGRMWNGYSPQLSCRLSGLRRNTLPPAQGWETPGPLALAA